MILCLNYIITKADNYQWNISITHFIVTFLPKLGRNKSL